MDTVARIGAPAPDFRLTDLEGRMHTPRRASGHILVLNFWSAECPHSVRLDQALTDLQAAWGGKVEVWCIAPNANEDLASIRAAAEARGVPVVLPDASQVAADRYGVMATPHLFVLDGEGILRYSGAPDDVTFRQRTPTRNYLSQAIEALLAGREPDPAQTRAFGCAVTRFPTGG
jgi:thiol-disulfide isomerase/thioredoxin